MIHEISKQEFTAEKYAGLAERMCKQQGWPRPFNSDHFFARVQGMYDAGIVKIWGCDSGLLAGLFVSNLFTGTPDAIIAFWWADRSKESASLFEAFKAEAERLGCIRMLTATFGTVNQKKIARLYRMKGFEQTEQIFCKFLR